MNVQGASMRHKAGQVTWFALIAIVGVTWFMVGVVVLHFLRADLEPATHMISEYAVGRFSYVQTANFFSLGIGSVALAIGLWMMQLGRIGPALIGTWGVLAFASGIFPTDGEAAPTTTGIIHELLGISGFVLVTISIFVFSWRFRSRSDWRPFALPTLVWGLTALATFFLVPVLGEAGQGIGQRIFLTVVVSWLLVTAVRLRSISRGERVRQAVPVTSSEARG